MNDFPSECFLITDFSSHGVKRWKDGTICTLRCYTHDGSFITLWGDEKASDCGGMDNIEEFLEVEADMLPILIQCEYRSTTQQYRPRNINWDNEVEIIDFRVSLDETGEKLTSSNN